MGRTLTLGLAATAALGLAGCAGVPVALSAASAYVDAVLFLRTGRSSTDHAISAVAERDCAVSHILTRGRLCDDGPPPPLFAELLRDPSAPAPAADRVELAAADPLVLSDAVPTPGAAALAPPPAAPATPVAATAVPLAPAPAPGFTMASFTAAAAAKAVFAKAVFVPPARPGPLVDAGSQAGTRSLLVVVGSFTRREQAETRRAALALPSTGIVEATVFGRRHYRVVVRPMGREDAQRQLIAARTAGVRDAWLLPWSDDALAVGDAVAALP